MSKPLVQMITGARRSGKGSFYRIKTSDQKYIDNYNKIDWNYSKKESKEDK
jgi:hypothetical protein|tara:strand:- start:1102 stop:1254 length:153 start_codon:yes stop_codon:yes gene_type:complete